jgi:hypothetical protein
MPRPKLSGPCAVPNCSKYTPFYRTFTENACKTAQQEGTLLHFAYLQVGNQLCCPHYNDIVALSRHKKRKCSRTPSLKQVKEKSNCSFAVESNQEINEGMGRQGRKWDRVFIHFSVRLGFFVHMYLRKLAWLQ